MDMHFGGMLFNPDQSRWFILLFAAAVAAYFDMWSPFTVRVLLPPALLQHIRIVVS